MLKNKINKALDTIQWARNSFENLAVACSFGKDSMVVLHLALQVDPQIEIFTVSTPFKPPQTLAYRDKILRDWNLFIHEFHQSDDIAAGSTELWKTDPEGCCEYFKVRQTREAVRSLSLNAWICGLRKTEGITRCDFDYIESKNGLVKVNPILEFTEPEIWLYHALAGIPPNPLYLEGYRSLGCSPCSVPGGETERSGRWANTTKQGGECGIHTMALR